MNKFFTKHAGTIILVVGALIVGGFSDSVLDRAFPRVSGTSKEIVKTMMIEALKTDEVKAVLVDIIRQENQSIKDDIKTNQESYIVIVDYVAADWARMIKKLYDYVVGDKPFLWSDISFMLSKWEKLPDNYKNPELVSKYEYLLMRYNNHINNGEY